MEIKEFGEHNKPIILLIHGFCMPLSMWKAQIDVFRKQYHILVPVLDGHESEVPSTFVSVENSANQIINYLKEHNYKEIFAICGFSLGGAISLYILATNQIIVKKAIVDAGITPLHTSKIKESLIVHKDLFLTALGRRNKKLLEIAFSPKDYSKEFVDEFYSLLQRVSNTTVSNVYYSVDTYALPKDLSRVNTEIQYWYGTKEEKERKRDAEFVTNAFPNANSRLFNGYKHGQLCVGNPELYLKSACDFFSRI